MAIINDVLGKIVEASLWADIRMLRSWPLVCWESYKCIYVRQSVWPRIVRSDFTGIFKGDGGVFDQYVNSGGTAVGMLRYGVVYVKHRLLRLFICIAGCGDWFGPKRMGLGYSFAATSQTSRVSIHFDEQGCLTCDTRLMKYVPLYRALVKIFPELFHKEMRA